MSINEFDMWSLSESYLFIKNFLNFMYFDDESF